MEPIRPKILIAGGTGFLGNVLSEYFVRQGAEVVVLSRSGSGSIPGVTYVQWDAKNLRKWTESLEATNVVINLAGKSVNCRYTEANKKEIFDSRTDSTYILGKAILAMALPPQLWINAASATIYRHAEDRPMDEFTGEFGNDFSVQVCRKWEKTFTDISLTNTRKVILRLAIVLGKNDGVLIRFQNLVRYGLGGKQGKGTQYFSWLHEADFIGIIQYIIENKELNGVYNASSPKPIVNSKLMHTFRSVAKAPLGFPSPTWLLKIGAGLIGTETELLLKSRWVIPARLQQAGYQFRFPEIKKALENLYHS